MTKRERFLPVTEIKKSKSWHPTPNSWAGQPSFKFTRFQMRRHSHWDWLAMRQIQYKCYWITHVKLLKRVGWPAQSKGNMYVESKGVVCDKFEWPTRSSQEGDQTWGHRKDVGPLKSDLAHYSCGVFNKVTDGKQSKKWASMSHFTALLLGAQWQG